MTDFSLGAVNGVQCSTELTTSPWTLDVDTLVISTGGGLGRLGRAVKPYFDRDVWETFDLMSVSNNRPGVVPIVRIPDRVPSLERVICVTLHDKPEIQPTIQAALRNIPKAAMAALRRANDLSCRQLAIPLLGAGGLGLTAGSSAEAMVPAVRSALVTYGSSIRSLIFIGINDHEIAAVRSAWSNAEQATPDTESEKSPGPRPPGPNVKAPSPQRRSDLTPAAVMVLRGAAEAAGSREVESQHILFAALERTVTRDVNDVAAHLLRIVVNNTRTTATHLLDELAKAIGAANSSFDDNDDRMMRLPGVTNLVREAAEIPASLGMEPVVHARHLLAAAVSNPMPADVTRALGTDPYDLRRHLLEAVLVALPSEPEDRWRRALGLQVGSAATSPPDEAQGVSTTITYSAELAGGISEDLVNPDRGIPLDQDHLGVSTYVKMLATVIARADTPLPLSVGPFGEWGSGKSYFMALLRQQIKEQSLSEDDAYLKNIVQIGFNAWSYADSNLWASLGDEIFGQLAGPGAEIEANKAVGHEKQELTKRLKSLREALDTEMLRAKELESARTRANQETQRLREQLEKAGREHHTSLISLVRAVGQSEDLKLQLDTVWSRLDISDELEQGRLFAAEVQGTHADFNVLRSLMTGRRATVAVIITTLFLAGATWLVATGAPGRWLAGLCLTGVATLLGTATFVVHQSRRGLRTLADIARKAREEHALQEMSSVRLAEAQEQVIQAQLDEVKARAGELGRELVELSPGQRLYSFLSERAGSDDYRRQLGLTMGSLDFSNGIRC